MEESRDVDEYVYIDVDWDNGGGSYSRSFEVVDSIWGEELADFLVNLNEIESVTVREIKTTRTLFVRKASE